MNKQYLAAVASLSPFLVLALVGSACGSSSASALEQLNLDRPVALAFGCYGGLRLVGDDGAQVGDPVVRSAAPQTVCDTYALPEPVEVTDPANVPTGQEDLSAEGGVVVTRPQYLGFVLQSVPGTVAIAQFDAKPIGSFAGADVVIRDADPTTPGKNSISVGLNPVAIATARKGCFAVTANAGSCDLSVLDIDSALADPPNPIVDRQDVLATDGTPIVARPIAMLAEPPSGKVGAACEATPDGLVYIAYPGCHAVAAVDLATHTVVSSIRFAADGTATIGGGDLSCPAECGDAAPEVPGIRPVAIDLREDPRTAVRRLVIGAENSPQLTIVDLDSAFKPLAVSQIGLEGDVGIIDLALSPEIGMGGDAGVIDDEASTGGQSTFVYAVATDGTVRVAEIESVIGECDTEVDPRFIHDEHSVARLACFEVGAVGTPPRRPDAKGPGIEVLGEGVPTAVAIVRADALPGEVRVPGPTKLVGYFGVVTTTAGQSFIINVDDDDAPDVEVVSAPIAVALPDVLPHQLRDALPDRDALAEVADAATGVSSFICNTDGPDPDTTTGITAGPRATSTPIQLTSSVVVSPDKVSDLPTIRQVLCTGVDATKPVSQLGFAAPVDVREKAFPDLRALRSDETWSLAWEGALSADSDVQSIDGPAIRAGTLRIDASGMHVVDRSHPFCAAGVQPYDIVQLRGCDPTLGDSQCDIGERCYIHPDSEIGVGSCLPADSADALSGPCREMLISLRRYSAITAASGELQLVPRRRVLRTSPVTGCTGTAQCDDLALVQARLASPSQPFEDTTTAPAGRAYTCELDPSRAGTVARCVMTCSTDADCDTGTVCDGGRCVEGLIPPSQCLPGSQRFDLRASDAFTVLGSRSGYLHPIIADADGTCVVDPEASPLDLGRIPLTAPPCVDDALTSVTPNPCQAGVAQTELQPRYASATCIPADPASELVTRDATAIRFRNRGLTFELVDPTYPGDLTCRGDRAGGLVDVPLVYSGYVVKFRQTGGFAAVQLNVAATAPVKVVSGPQESIWIVDSGDFLSVDGLSASTRGKVFRVESSSLSTINILQ